MDIALILRAFLLSAMLCRVYSFPAKGYYGHQPLAQPGQMQTGWPSSSSTDVQQSGPPQTPGLYTQSSPGVSPMTFSGEVKGSMPQTSSGYEEFEAAPPVFDPHFNYWRQPSYKAGTLIQRGATYEHGNEESESHDSGYLQPPPPLRAFSEGRVPDSNEPLESQFYSPAHVQGANGVPEPSNVSPPEELYDARFFHMFITGQLPPGTVTHFSSTDEHGSNAWTDISFERIPPPPYRKTNTKVHQAFSQPPQKPWKFTW
ncbi:uncharacterized protein LOC116218117 [Clupea harengus]|uniref:Uncharacterized protein LOC116218117 n=1 Tax=Clupea harengus TaxID=7950 RepID=A0A6P8EDZ9_CLUHA|nr:uncharacterized protein LOC116218117 [Clupea harengus]